MSFKGKFSRLRVAAVLLVLSIAAPSGGQTSITAPLKSAAAALPKIHIDNFGQVNAHYYRGAMPKATDFTDLASLGVKTMIDLTDKDGQAEEKRLAEQAGMKFFRIPMDTHVVPTPTEMASFLEIVTDPANLPVYVHCVGGRHRTGVMTAIYRMTQDGWTPDQAFKEMKKYKFGADFLHPEFKKFVYDFKNIAVAAAPAGGSN
jgi:tyrosine-protein phosphatase SIW14